jgi:hypothetical protein
MNQDKKRIIKANLDKVLKPLGIKYSLSVQNNMAITCTITKAPIDFVSNFNNKAMKDPAFQSMPDALKPRAYVQVNPYWYQEHFTGEAKDILGQAFEALRSAGYYDRSDAMVDYFDTAYYYHLNLGTYNKPLEVTK